MYDGKLIDVDNEDIEKLKTISEEIKEKNKKLEEKTQKILHQ